MATDIIDTSALLADASKETQAVYGATYKQDQTFNRANEALFNALSPEYGFLTNAWNDLAKSTTSASNQNIDLATYIDSPAMEQAGRAGWDRAAVQSGKIGGAYDIASSLENAQQVANNNIYANQRVSDAVDTALAENRKAVEASKWGILAPIMGLFNSDYDVNYHNAKAQQAVSEAQASVIKANRANDSIMQQSYGQAGYNPLADPLIDRANQLTGQYIQQQTALQQPKLKKAEIETQAKSNAIQALNAYSKHLDTLAQIKHDAESRSATAMDWGRAKTNVAVEEMKDLRQAVSEQNRLYIANLDAFMRQSELKYEYEKLNSDEQKAFLEYLIRRQEDVTKNRALGIEEESNKLARDQYAYNVKRQPLEDKFRLLELDLRRLGYGVDMFRIESDLANTNKQLYKQMLENSRSEASAQADIKLQKLKNEGKASGSGGSGSGSKGPTEGQMGTQAKEAGAALVELPGVQSQLAFIASQGHRADEANFFIQESVNAQETYANGDYVARGGAIGVISKVNELAKGLIADYVNGGANAAEKKLRQAVINATGNKLTARDSTVIANALVTTGVVDGSTTEGYLYNKWHESWQTQLVNVMENLKTKLSDSQSKQLGIDKANLSQSDVISLIVKSASDKETADLLLQVGFRPDKVARELLSADTMKVNGQSMPLLDWYAMKAVSGVEQLMTNHVLSQAKQATGKDLVVNIHDMNSVAQFMKDCVTYGMSVDDARLLTNQLFSDNVREQAALAYQQTLINAGPEIQGFSVLLGLDGVISNYVSDNRGISWPDRVINNIASNIAQNQQAQVLQTSLNERK